jgi:hypothetical protein
MSKLTVSAVSDDNLYFKIDDGPWLEFEADVIRFCGVEVRATYHHEQGGWKFEVMTGDDHG